MKHYLIDSENVGDFWIPLLELPADQAELIVFYTKNSPHMSYDSLIRLKESDRTVTFIKCYEGTNALDFQLCSELGFLIAGNENDDFIIVTNDTGYDAAVKYWRHKEYSVKRIAGKDSRTGSRRRGTPARYDVAAEVNAILHKLARSSELLSSGMDEDDTDTDLTDMTEGIEDVSGSQEPEETIQDPVYDEDTDDISEEYGEEEETDPEFGPEPEEPYEEDQEPEEEDAEEEEQEEPALYEDETDDSLDAETDESGPAAVFREEEAEDDLQQEEAVAAMEEAEAVTAAETAKDTAAEEEETQKDAEEAAAFEDAEQAEAAEAGDDSEITESGPFIPDQEEITAIVNCIGMENLAELHNQLIQFYGDNGKDIYQSIKSGSLIIEKQDWDKEEKFLYYCALILRHSDEPEETLSEESITEFAQFLLGAENKRKNLNSLRYALLKHYGKEKGRRYYFMLKPYVKALNQM